jgi:hypothetical protein
MVAMEERVKSLEQEVAGMKAILNRSASVKSDWESTVGAPFESDPLFKEALRLGREYRESQPPPEDREGA